MSPRGTHHHIAHQIAQQVTEGTLAPGTALPSESELSRQMNVARGTVRRALRLVDQMGLTETVPGVGRRVTGAPPHPTTTYATVAAKLHERITDGEFTAVFPLPSIPEVMQHYGVSRTTARRAYALLADQHLVVIRHGSGTYLATTDAADLPLPQPQECT